ncbi:hypothetical protein Ciccas_001555 [Cichlidogyrus casuarinus]|uniref:SNF2 N-terminal domain-containing protein n=1 Tax=Cichlidogyrus casuarinus TaxID=1844966 RepID=A0ABD2QKV6_9PLAT
MFRNYSEDKLNQTTKDAQHAEFERQQRIQSLSKLQPELVQSQFQIPAQSASQKLFSKNPCEFEEAIILADEDDLLDLSPSNYVFLEVSDEDTGDEPDEIEMEVCELRDAKNLPDEEGRLVINQNRGSDESVVQIAPHLVKVIKPHQVTGVRFLYENLIENTSAFKSSEGFGCILAHSMGLGKTIQVITFIELLYRYTEAQHTLIIVPINTLQNWIAEFNKWLPLENRNFSTPEVKKVTSKRKTKEEKNESKSNEDETEKLEIVEQEKVWTNKLRFRKRPFELHAIRDVHKTISARHHVS